MTAEVIKTAWAAKIRTELLEDILPFWLNHVADTENGGFHGYVSCDLTIDKQAPRASVINNRILWTFSAAARMFDNPRYLENADRAYHYIVEKFWDHEYGGVYWMLDAGGKPVSDRKQIYAQAFAIYGISEYFRSTGKPDALDYAKRLFRLIEDNSRDPVHGGYIEARSRDWGPLEDLRLSGKDLNSPKSMNTHLHIIEAYTNLLRVWPDAELRAAQCALLQVTMDHVIDRSTGHFKLFFDNEWNPLTGHRSFGHDIEGSWLLVEAAQVLGDAQLIDRTRTLALKMAEAVYAEGLDRDGSLFYEADSKGNLTDPNKHWWAQAEGVVGFYNAYQLSGDERFRQQAHRVWDYIERNVVDRAHGEWHAKLRPDGTPWTEQEDSDACLAGPWKCPYHNSRVCFEMIERLKE